MTSGLTRLTLISLLASSMLASGAFLGPAKAQGGGIVLWEGGCFDAAAKARFKELTLDKQHDEYRLKAERSALASYQARLPSAERRVEDDKALIAGGANTWPAGFNPQEDLNAATQAVNDLILDIQLSQEHIPVLEANIADDDQQLIALSHLPPCADQPPQVGYNGPYSPPPQNPPPQVGQNPPDSPPIQIGPIQIGPNTDNPGPLPPDNPQIGLNNPPVPQQPVQPPPSLPPGVDRITAGPNGTTFEHHTDGSTVIRGPGGNVVGMIDAPMKQPLNQPQPKSNPNLNVPLGEEPSKPAIVKTDAAPTPKTTERKEQSVIDAFKQTGPAKPDVKADPDAKPKVGLVTPQPELKSAPLQELKSGPLPPDSRPAPVTPQVKTEPNLTTVNPPKTNTRLQQQVTTHREAPIEPTLRGNTVPHVSPAPNHVTTTHFANPGPTVARLAPQAPTMRVNAFRPAPAPRPGGLTFGGLRSRDTQPSPALEQTEEKPTEQAK